MNAENTQRIKGMLGFARRAGKTVIGTDLICKELSRGRVKLVVISSSASDGTKSRLVHKCEWYAARYLETAIDKEELGTVLGKDTEVAAVALTDDAFAEEIIKAKGSQN